MTTFLLHGGEASAQSPQNDAFFVEFSNLVEKDEVSILLCYFARNPNQWDELRERDWKRVMASAQKQATWLIAMDPKDLFQKLPDADVLYVAGGDAEPIERLLPELGGLKNALGGKVYIGSSMGVFIASQNYVLSSEDQDQTSVHQGLGLLPINSLCHWNVEPEKDVKLQLLQNTSSHFPILTLDEHQWVRMEY